MEYVTVSAIMGAFHMLLDVQIEDCASFFVNPHTAVGILDTAERVGTSKAIVHTAAASQLGQMLNKLAPTRGMEIINIIRRPEKKELLVELGAKHVIVTEMETPPRHGSWSSMSRRRILVPHALSMRCPGT